MEKIHLWPDKIVDENGLLTVQVIIEEPQNQRKNLWYRLPNNQKTSLSKNCDPFVVAHIFNSMRKRADLYPPDGDWYDIPYRCLTAQRVDNLLVSGRCISATHQGMAGARVMGTCMAIGQAAGTAAALAVRAGVDPRDVHVPTLRQALRDDGALV